MQAGFVRQCVLAETQVGAVAAQIVRQNFPKRVLARHTARLAICCFYSDTVYVALWRVWLSFQRWRLDATNRERLKMNSHAMYSNDHEPRRVGAGLAIGIFLMPVIFAWVLLRTGYTAGARIMSFGWLGLLVTFGALANGGSTPASNTPSAPAPPVAQVAQTAEADRAWKAANAEEARREFKSAEARYPEEGEDYRPYNRRLTAAYRKWVKAEEAYRGEDWRAKYIAEHTVNSGDCAGYAKMGLPSADCAAMAAYSPTIPTLESLLLPRQGATSSSSETESTPPPENEGEPVRAPIS